MHLDAKGRGRALKAVWSASDAPVLAYMDVDLSTDLRGAAAAGRTADLRVTRTWRSAPGCRAVEPGGARTEAGVHLAQLQPDAARDAVGVVHRRAVRLQGDPRRRGARPAAAGARTTTGSSTPSCWCSRERAGLRIHEVPVDWVDDPDSRVDIVATARADLRGIARLAARLRAPAACRWPGCAPQLGRRRRGCRRRCPACRAGCSASCCASAGSGVLSTLAYFVLYLGLRDLTGPAGGQPGRPAGRRRSANTAANRRLTFGVRGRRRGAAAPRGRTGRLRGRAGLTSGSLWALHQLSADPNRWGELSILVAANAVSTLVRFLSLRQLMAHRR